MTVRHFRAALPKTGMHVGYELGAFSGSGVWIHLWRGEGSELTRAPAV
jgi:hypothetical protein